MTVVTADVQAVAYQGDVTLSISVRGAENGASASFEIHKTADDSVVTTVQGEVQNGAAEAQWDPAITPDGEERGLRVYYIVTVAEQTYRSQELEVYLDYIEVTSVDEQDQVLQDVPYEVRVGDEVRNGTTGSTGTHRESGLPPGDLVFEWRGPYQVVEWVDETGPTRKAKLKVVKRLRFEFPSPEGNGGARAWQEDGTEAALEERYFAWTQWTNLPYADTEQGRCNGPELRCKVRGVEPTAIQPGEKCYVKVEWPAEADRSPRNDPQAPRELVGGDDEPWAQGDTQKGLELEFDTSGMVEFVVKLGKAGGDTVTISVGGSDRCEDAKLVVTNRRKVFYRTGRLFQHQALPDLSLARGWLGAGAVELHPERPAEPAPYPVSPEPEGEAGKRGLARVPAEWFAEGATGERCVIGGHNFDWFKELYAPQGDARTVHLVLADAIITGTQADNATNLAQAFSVRTPAPPEDGAVSFEVFVPIPQPARVEVFERSLGDGGPCLRGATWRTRGGRGVPRRLRNRTGPIEEGWVRVARHRVETRTVTQDDGQQVEVTHDGKKGVWVRFPEDSEPGQALEAGARLLVEGTMHVGRVGMQGLSQAFQIAVVTNDDPLTTNVRVAHELGHNLRLAPFPDPEKDDLQNGRFFLPPGMEFLGDTDPASAQPNQHRWGFHGHGFLGSHCWAGLDDAGATHVMSIGANGQEEHTALSGAAHEAQQYPALRKDEGGTYVKVAGTCVMYGGTNPQLAPNVTGFCEDCQKFLRAGDLEDVTKDWSSQALDDVEPASGLGEEQPEAKLRVQLLSSAHQPCANTSYELGMPDGTTASGSTDADGWLEQPWPEKRDAVLTLKYTPEGEDEVVIPVHLTAAMDEDCESDQVFLAHLRNLGFARDGDADDTTVARFQGAVGMPATGVLDEATKDRIDELVVSEDPIEPLLRPADWEA